MSWRILAIALLLCFATRESWILRMNPRALNVRWSVEVAWYEWYELRDRLIPVCAILVLIGLALGMGAGASFTRPRTGRPRPYWLFVPLAVIAAALFLGQSAGGWSVVQLILCALEGVNNATKPAYRATSSGLSERLLRAGTETVPAALACLWLALLVARDFERARRGEPWAMTRGGWVLRLLSLGAVLASGIVVAFVAIPTMHPHLFDGFRKVLEPEILAIILAGFGTVAAGLAARTLVPRPTREKPRWLRRLSAVAPFVLIAIILLSAWRCLPASTQLDPAVPAVVGRLCDSVAAFNIWLESLLPEGVVLVATAWRELEPLACTLSMIVVASFVLELTFSRFVGGAARAIRRGRRVARADDPIPLADLGPDRGLRRRYAGLDRPEPDPDSYPSQYRRLDGTRLAIAVLRR